MKNAFWIGSLLLVLCLSATVGLTQGDGESLAMVSVNQVGYYPAAPKFAMLANSGDAPVTWEVVNFDSAESVLSGETTLISRDAASGDSVQVADFTALTTPGTYQIVIQDVTSDPFSVASDVYTQLPVDAARYFYLNRSGIELLPEYAGEDYARPAGHMTDDDITCYSGTDADNVTWAGCDYRLNAQGGWYDAGDYGKYVVNGGISLWTLLNLYERLPDAYPDGSLNIPESGNGISDILDEARWQMEFMLAMQVPEGYPQAGMAHHKLHSMQWDGMPAHPATEYDNDQDSSTQGRYLMPPSTAATYNLAATAAQCARIWREIDADFSQRCLTAAETAFEAATTNPIALAGRTPGNGGGDYGDNNVTDDRFWAAAELYITTAEVEYLDAMAETSHLARFSGLDGYSAMYWGNTGALGSLSLVMHEADLPDDWLDTVRDQIVQTADKYLNVITREGYRVPITQYDWGSNSSVLNNAMILAYVYDIGGDTKYLHGVAESMDYLLGRNALAFSFVSGYGARSMQHPHHRFWGNQPDFGYPAPPPGVVAGGPNGNPSDPTAMEEAQLDAGPARRYVDLIGSWSTNEVTINWNAPLVWVTAYLDAQSDALS